MCINVRATVQTFPIRLYSCSAKFQLPTSLSLSLTCSSKTFSNICYDILICPWKSTWNSKMEVWKMIFLFNYVIFRFHGNFPECSWFVQESSFTSVPVASSPSGEACSASAAPSLVEKYISLRVTWKKITSLNSPLLKRAETQSRTVGYVLSFSSQWDLCHSHGLKKKHWKTYIILSWWFVFIPGWKHSQIGFHFLPKSGWRRIETWLDKPRDYQWKEWWWYPGCKKYSISEDMIYWVWPPFQGCQWEM